MRHDRDQQQSDTLLAVLDKGSATDPAALDSFIDCSALLVDTGFLTDLLVKKRKQVGKFLAAGEVESGWDDGQVLGLILASLLWGPDTVLGARQIAQDYKN